MKPIRLLFDCETISPLFNSGPNKNIPSLRSNSIKGMLRYWWRAINFDLDLKTMGTIERMIFGGVGQGGDKAYKSPIMVRVFPLRMEEEDRIALLPHRIKQEKYGKNPRFQKGFLPGSLFQLELTLLDSPILFRRKKGEELELMNTQKLKALVMCWALLGGLGRRTRRGMGAFRIRKINDQPIDWPNSPEKVLQYLNQVPVSVRGRVKKLFSLSPEGDFVEMAESYHAKINSYVRYPFIREIFFGKTPSIYNEDLLIKIGDVSSHLLDKHQRFYPKALGSGKPRYASPLYVSTLDGFLPIITCLNTLPKPDRKILDIQNDFIAKILE